jgi:ATP-dependent helicase/nuclease subunit A
MTFQDWILAIYDTYKNLPFKVEFVTDDDLTEEKIGQIEMTSAIKPDDLKDNRQTENIAEALDRLEAVEKLNTEFKAAINLPSLRTPSQVKKLYEPVMDVDGVDVMAKPYQAKPTFELPDFSKKAKVEATAIGSAMHELMQRITLSEQVTLDDITSALAQVSAEDDVKSRIRLEHVLDFFEGSELGQMIQKNVDKIHREAPFAMLKEDPESKEKFVVRGIVDGYLLFDGRIVLFDYKTDKYTNSEDIKKRYQGQMALYAEALSKSYHIEQVDKYLVLLGGENLEVVKL